MNSSSVSLSFLSKVLHDCLRRIRVRVASYVSTSKIPHQPPSNKFILTIQLAYSATPARHITTMSSESPRKRNLTVLISGSGTNLQALIDACGQSPLQNAQITRVISNKKDAFGLTRAEKAGIATSYHNLVAGGYKKRNPQDIQKAREEYDADLAKLIIDDKHRPDLVVCAGWMHILSPVFVDAMQRAKIPVINLHPALPKQFDGANAIGRAWDAYQKGEIVSTGVMIHYVISEVDRGEPIITQDVKCQGCEVESDLETRIHNVEWKLIVEGTGKALAALETEDTD